MEPEKKSESINTKRTGPALAAACLGVLLALPARLPAASLAVTNLADSGPGTLRAVLAGAADGDTIDATGVSGTVTLTSLDGRDPLRLH